LSGSVEKTVYFETNVFQMAISMEHNSSLEAHSRLAGQEIPYCFLEHEGLLPCLVYLLSELNTHSYMLFP
jgi:hypothetical protein